MTAIAEEKPSRRGRGARREARQAVSDEMLPALRRRLPLVEPMSPEQVERIDAASMDILEDVGVVFRDPQAIEDWRRAGADIRDGDRVHLDRGLVRELVATIPESFTYHARNPLKSLPFGADHAIFVPMTGAPYRRAWAEVRRGPTLAAQATVDVPAEMLPALHSSAH
ncbi:MAG: trimethylamine methyltransferase family protein, partial [Pseudomonadota bacterium]